MTYPLVASLLGAAGARLREVRVNRLAEETFYAQIVVESDTSVQTLDARPSDALNLALAAGAPVRVAAAVFEAAAVTPDVGAAAWSGDRSEGAAAIVADLPGWPPAPAPRRVRSEPLERGRGA